MYRKSAAYYDVIYDSIEKDYPRESEILRSIFERHGIGQGSSLLDVACGTGSHLAQLRKWYRAEGVDLDREMLAIARRKLPDVPLHRGEMARFNLGKAFDVVVCLFSAIGYARSPNHLAESAANLARHTRPGGLVVVEPWFSPDAFQATGVHAVFVDQPALKLARVNRNRVDGRTSVLDFHYLVATPDGVRRFREQHRLTLFTEAEYTSALTDAGLEVHVDPQGLDGRGLYLAVKPGREDAQPSSSRGGA